VKKILCAALAALTIAASSVSALAAGYIPDHKGTPMDGFEIGTKPLPRSVLVYSELFEMSGDQYGVDPNLLAAICAQESGGVNYDYHDDGTPYPAWGIMQIEYTLEREFAAFGKHTTGVEWTLEDRLDPGKAVPFAAHLIAESLYKYDCDYLKMIQAYNFGQGMLDKIVAAKGDDWLSERANAKSYLDDWPYETYGDPLYIEHVLRYYHNRMPYRAAKVRYNGRLIKFADQAPIVDEGSTMVPVRAVSEILGAKVNWNSRERQAEMDLNGTEIIIPTDSDVAYVNGEERYLTAKSELLNNRTMVPLRFIAESFGLNVSWDGSTRTVNISK